MPLADARFQTLASHAATYVANWPSDQSADFSELRNPSGRKKARVSAITALLKPGNSPIASIEDQGWIDSGAHDSLRPLSAFLDAIFADGVASNPKAVPHPEFDAP